MSEPDAPPTPTVEAGEGPAAAPAGGNGPGKNWKSLRDSRVMRRRSGAITQQRKTPLKLTINVTLGHQTS